MSFLVEDGVGGRLGFLKPVLKLGIAQLIVRLIQGRSGAAKGDAEAVTGVQDDAGVADGPLDTGGLSGGKEDLFVKAVAVAGNP
jgi:hypothetical protein